jgi:hypothetical protein
VALISLPLADWGVRRSAALLGRACLGSLILSIVAQATVSLFVLSLAISIVFGALPIFVDYDIQGGRSGLSNYADCTTGESTSLLLFTHQFATLLRGKLENSRQFLCQIDQLQLFILDF